MFSTSLPVIVIKDSCFTNEKSASFEVLNCGVNVNLVADIACQSFTTISPMKLRMTTKAGYLQQAIRVIADDLWKFEMYACIGLLVRRICKDIDVQYQTS